MSHFVEFLLDVMDVGPYGHFFYSAMPFETCCELFLNEVDDVEKEKL